MTVYEYGKQNDKQVLFIATAALEPYWAFQKQAETLGEDYHVYAVSADGHDGKPGDFISIEKTVSDMTALLKERGVTDLSLILVEGQLQSRTYQTKDGSNRSVVEIVADKAHFTGERRDSQSNQQQSQPSQHGNRQQTNLPPAQQGPGYATDYEAPPLGDDDLPF